MDVYELSRAHHNIEFSLMLRTVRKPAHIP